MAKRTPPFEAKVHKVTPSETFIVKWGPRDTQARLVHGWGLKDSKMPEITVTCKARGFIGSYTFARESPDVVVMYRRFHAPGEARTVLVIMKVPFDE